MKAHTLFLRGTYRDYYDLYVIAKYHLRLDQIYENAQLMIPGINSRLLSSALRYIDDIENENIDYLQPKYKVTASQIKRFFEDEIKAYIKGKYSKE
jgi:hypothetical protein